MAFEAKVRARVLLFDVLDGAATFDTADGETRGVCETTNDPRLPLEGRLHGFVEGGRVVQVDDVDITIRSADHKEFVLDVHSVNTFLTFHLRDGGLLSQIPVFHFLVP